MRRNRELARQKGLGPHTPLREAAGEPRGPAGRKHDSRFLTSPPYIGEGSHRIGSLTPAGTWQGFLGTGDEKGRCAELEGTSSAAIGSAARLPVGGHGERHRQH